ncbi:leukocyte receptor cluster member 1 homolog [Chelonus insularis]|uniref:leukocyte receptor cluster member 1 homolog n=1 Tax=Chelonus insularis TaxID=460826 RepID=UPI00158CD10E|nr:leukocyte receptor cluster member 1 homolog [Chelonus insularis]
MNILPKKRWHVRTRENIARVRRDEAKAAEEERTKKARAQKAETEARIEHLRQQRREKYDGRDHDVPTTSQLTETHEHINFFKDLEEGKIDNHRPNADHEAEIKAEKEKYEKKIGYLTYLGQDTNEATGAKNWYDEIPKRLNDPEPEKEVQEKKKMVNDPINDIKRYLHIMHSSSSSKAPENFEKTSKKRKLESDSDNDSRRSSKRHKKDKKKAKKNKKDEREYVESDKPNVNIEKLRAERLLREQKEKLRTEALLAKLRGDPIPIVEKEEPKPAIRQKYNSQFCPDIARQNIERTPKR